MAGYEYQREGNPTNDRLRAALAALEGGETACTFASGMAAMTIFASGTARSNTAQRASNPRLNLLERLKLPKVR